MKHGAKCKTQAAQRSVASYDKRLTIIENRTVSLHAPACREQKKEGFAMLKLGYNEATCKENSSVEKDLELCEKYGYDYI